MSRGTDKRILSVLPGPIDRSDKSQVERLHAVFLLAISSCKNGELYLVSRDLEAIKKFDPVDVLAVIYGYEKYTIESIIPHSDFKYIRPGKLLSRAIKHLGNEDTLSYFGYNGNIGMFDLKQRFSHLFSLLDSRLAYIESRMSSTEVPVNAVGEHSTDFFETFSTPKM